MPWDLRGKIALRLAFVCLSVVAPFYSSCLAAQQATQKSCPPGHVPPQTRCDSTAARSFSLATSDCRDVGPSG